LPQVSAFDVPPRHDAAGRDHMMTAEKNIVVTGASSGLGLAASLLLGEQGARVGMICRDSVRGRFMRNEIASYGIDRPPILFLADLSSQSQIRGLADELRSAFTHIDVLINNAGAMFARRELTEDGIEKTLAVNHLAPFLLTSLVLDLIASAPAGRIVMVTSSHHSGTLDFENLQGERHYNFLDAYNRSKLRNILFSYELARQLADTRVTANCVSPGPTLTRLGDNMTGFPRMISLALKSIRLVYPEGGADPLVFLASSARLDSVTGRFFQHCREKQSKPITYDVDVAKCLWLLSEALCDLS
jgi:NAD(P)-dependent dehydrogenase (short-subunit alcohol dehydrogenase family)